MLSLGDVGTLTVSVVKIGEYSPLRFDTLVTMIFLQSSLALLIRYHSTWDLDRCVSWSF